MDGFVLILGRNYFTRQENLERRGAASVPKTLKFRFEMLYRPSPLYFYLNKIHIMNINTITCNQLSPLHN